MPTERPSSNLKSPSGWTRKVPFYYGWIIVPASAAGLFVSGPGQTYAISLFVDPLIDEFGWSRTTVSGLYTAGSLTAASGMLGIGWLMDRLGARIVLAVVTLLMGAAAIFMSTVDHQFELYLGFGALRLLGQGSLTMVPTALLALWFVTNRGRVTALAGLGAVASQALFPPFIYFLIDAYGWRDAWLVLGIVVWAIMLPIAIVIVRDSPQSIGIKPRADSREREDAGDSHEGSGWPFRAALSTRTFWLLLLATSSQSLISTALVFHHGNVLDSRGIDPSISAVVLSVMGPASFAGVAAGGVLADRYQNRYLLVLGQGLLMIAILLAMAVSTNWHAIAYGLLLGGSSGFTITVGSVIWPNYFGTLALGKIRGAATMAMVAAAALGPLPFALGLGLFGSYQEVLGLSLFLPAVSALMAYWSRKPMPPTPPRKL